MEVYPSRTQLPELLPQPVLAGVIGGVCFLSMAVILSTMAACIMNRRRAAHVHKRQQGKQGGENKSSVAPRWGNERYRGSGVIEVAHSENRLAGGEAWDSPPIILLAREETAALPPSLNPWNYPRFQFTSFPQRGAILFNFISPEEMECLCLLAWSPFEGKCTRDLSE